MKVTKSDADLYAPRPEASDLLAAVEAEQRRAEDELTDAIEAAFHRYWAAVAAPGSRCRVMVGRHPEAAAGSTLAAWAEPADDLDETSPEGLLDESSPDHYPDSIG